VFGCRREREADAQPLTSVGPGGGVGGGGIARTGSKRPCVCAGRCQVSPPLHSTPLQVNLYWRGREGEKTPRRKREESHCSLSPRLSSRLVSSKKQRLGLHSSAFMHSKSNPLPRSAQLHFTVRRWLSRTGAGAATSAPKQNTHLPAESPEGHL